MFQCRKHFLGLGNASPTPNQSTYPQNNISGPPVGPPYCALCQACFWLQFVMQNTLPLPSNRSHSRRGEPSFDASNRKENGDIEAEKPTKWAKLDPKKEKRGGRINSSKRKGDDETNNDKPTKHAKKSVNKQPRRTRAGNSREQKRLGAVVHNLDSECRVDQIAVNKDLLYADRDARGKKIHDIVRNTSVEHTSSISTVMGSWGRKSPKYNIKEATRVTTLRLPD
ncbi:hypothetical protein C8J57DRAFT_1222198 [Mycena rebaudengoi]|nr:hypothetical protein C8J57DRAFT_1222198 [Mycena rebaudengoi]